MDLCRSCWSGPAASPPDVADPAPAAPRWLRLVPVRVVFLVVLALAVLLGAGLVRAVVRALVRPLSSWRTGRGRRT